MTGRTPACEDSATIQARLRELQAERMAAIAGCACPPDTGTATGGERAHLPGCPLRAPPQAALALAVAMERLRARHSINRIPWLGRWGSGDFHTSPSGGAGSRLDVGRLPDAAGSTNPVSLEGLK